MLAPLHEVLTAPTEAPCLCNAASMASSCTRSGHKLWGGAEHLCRQLGSVTMPEVQHDSTLACGPLSRGADGRCLQVVA